MAKFPTIEEFIQQVKERVLEECLIDGEPLGELIDSGDLVHIVRCKDCKWGKEVCGNIECWCDMNIPPEYHGYDWFCPNGERKEE